MEASNLQTASTYLNNLLLARGLLRNGKPVDFASLSRGTSKDEKSVNRTDVTAQVINVVHDMILRRDRDQEHQETVAHTLQTLRTEASRNTIDIERVNNKNRDLARQLTQCQSTSRSALAQCNVAESSARALREEVARAKATLAQVRTQCANDVRKRDVQIQRLKTHLTAQQRGSRAGVVGPSISINPGSTGRGHGAAGSVGADGELQPNLEDTEYSLKQETTEFLTQLSQSLSDENDSLISLIRGALSTLKDLQGLPHNQQARPKSQESRSVQDRGDEHVQVLSASYESLAADLGSVLDNLRDLLTNPSFAPIEEVHMREEEIQRLREGWEKMEGRWKEAVVMMKGWRERMLSGGNTVNLDELRIGLGLGDGLENLAGSGRSINVIEEDQDEANDTEEDIAGPDAEENMDMNMAKLPDDEPSFSAPEPELILEAKVEGANGISDATKAKRQLTELDGNVDRVTSRKRSHDNLEDRENTTQHLKPNGLDLPNVEVRDRSKKARIPSSKHSRPSKVPQKTRTTSSKQPSKHCLPPPEEPSPAQEPNLSISEKLKLAESEARRASQEFAPSSPLEFNNNDTDGRPPDPVSNGTGTSGSPAKKTGIVGRPQRSRRRKSTLSPDELDNLLLVGADKVV